MTLSNLVTNQNLSERLKKLGVPQVSNFCYVPNPDGGFRFRSMEERGTYGRDVYISAFLSGELGEMLPKEIKVDGMLWFLTITYRDNGNGWYVWYEANLIGEHRSIYNLHNESLSDCLGEMLAYLLEHQIIDVAKIMSTR